MNRFIDPPTIQQQHHSRPELENAWDSIPERIGILGVRWREAGMLDCNIASRACLDIGIA
jgi:hypothetical protein